MVLYFSAAYSCSLTIIINVIKCNGSIVMVPPLHYHMFPVSSPLQAQNPSRGFYEGACVATIGVVRSI